jgi:hypothetical protein
MRPERRLVPHQIMIAVSLAALLSGALSAQPESAAEPKGFAEIDVQPTSLVLEVAQGDAATTTFLVTNEGSGLLIVYSIEDDAVWLSEDPSNFEVTSGAAQNVTVTADASALSLGVYNQSISIESNDEDESSIIVPIEVTVTESVGVNDPDLQKPNDLWLALPTPNPFSSRTTVRFRLPSEQAIRLEIMNLRGERVCLLAHGVMSSGDHTAQWNGLSSDGTSTPPGVYLARLETGSDVHAVPVLRLP